METDLCEQENQEWQQTPERQRLGEHTWEEMEIILKMELSLSTYPLCPADK